MSSAHTDSTQAQRMPVGLAAAGPDAPSELEREVVSLFQAHRTRLVSYVLAFGIACHDSEEVVQEVFLSLFRHLQMGKSRRNLRGWIFRVAHNLALKQRHANQRLRLERGAAFAETTEAHRDPALNPEEQLLTAQRQRRLLSVVDALPEQDRHCLYLRAEGLRYREIAEVLGISLGSVSASLSRSMARLMRADAW